ncbi:MAG: hypothetical protein ABL897_07730, partial [Hyphomicrobium sp.]
MPSTIINLASMKSRQCAGASMRDFLPGIDARSFRSPRDTPFRNLRPHCPNLSQDRPRVGRTYQGRPYGRPAPNRKMAVSKQSLLA